MVVGGAAQTPAQALRLLNEVQPDVVVLDLALAEGHGLELIKDIRAHGHEVLILVFTIFEEEAYAVRCLKAGARGYVTKHETALRLLSGIRDVLNGDYAVSRKVLNAFLDSSVHRPSHSVASIHSLRDRELEVFGLMGEGIGTREIAARLGRSVKTIETYQARIKEKLNLNTATALKREAVRWVESRH